MTILTYLSVLSNLLISLNNQGFSIDNSKNVCRLDGPTGLDLYNFDYTNFSRKVIDERMGQTLEQVRVGELGFMEQSEFIGAHVKGELDQWPRIAATGDVFYAINGSTDDITMAKYSLLSDLLRDRYVGLENFKLHLPDIIPGQTINVNFTLVKRQEFPYFTLRLIAKSSPNTDIVDYESFMGQIQEENREKPESYATIAQINSRSSFFDFMNFNLNQNFDNLDFKTGTEKMMLVLMQKLLLLVEGKWKGDTLTKSLRVSEALHRAGLPGVGQGEEYFYAGYESESDPKYSLMQFKISKDIIKDITRLLS